MSRTGPPDRSNNLNIDNVVASQPELGPSPPDGGYGWIILICTVIIQITVPSITIAYGILILYTNLQEEYEENEVFHLWKHNVIMVPISALIFSLLTASWSKTIISLAHRPRIISISGVCLISAGILLSSIGIDSEGDALIFNIFSGMLAGLGSSLTNQQAETLLNHYFRKRLHGVRAIYKTSILVGNIIMSILMGTLFTKFGVNYSLLLYTGIMLQNCIILIAFTRPTYIVAPLQQKYKTLKEASDDEDEEIYSSQNGPSPSNRNDAEENVQETGQENKFQDDEQDEEVISTFNAQNTTREIIQPNMARLDSTVRPYVIEVDNQFTRGDEPGSLYRETTVAYGEVSSNVFNFEATPTAAGTARRTENVKKNVVILISILKDLRFYVHTYVDLNVKFSALIMGLLFPAYVSQQLPHMELVAVVGLVVVIYLGSVCLNIVIAFLPNNINKNFFMGLFSLLSFMGFIVIAESNTKAWLIPAGILASFAITALYIVQKPICEDVQIEQEAYVITTVSNALIAVIICLITMIGDYEYVRYFKTAGILHIFSPILVAMVRKSA